MMKYSPLVCIVFLISAHLCGQPFEYDTTGYQLKELQYENADGEKGLTTFLYNKEGDIYKAVWQNLENKRYSENYFIYRRGRLKKLYREFSDSLTSTKVFSYDSLGRIQEEVFERSDGKKGHVFYVYNSGGKLTEMDCQGLNGWFHGKIMYSYKKGGLRKRAEIFRDNEQIGSIIYKYSKEGNLLNEHWDFNGGWWQSFEYVYEPKKLISWANSNPLLEIPNGWRIEHEKYSYNDKLGGPSGFRYSQDGKLLEKTFVRNDGLKTNTTYSYDKNRLIRQSERVYASGERAVFDYKYNAYGQITEKSFKHSSGKEGREAFLYDANGRLVAARYDNMDTWLTGLLIFKHNLFDQIIKADFISDKGYTAEIKFSYTDDGLINKVLWEFSFGASQLYEFEYTYIE
mgnify:CR=1 FL=1